MASLQHLDSMSQVASSNSLIEPLIHLCIKAAADGDHWRVQYRSLEHIPEHAANQLCGMLLGQGRLRPPQLPLFRLCVTQLDLTGLAAAEWMAYVAEFSHLHTLLLSRSPKLKDSHLEGLPRLASSMRQLSISGCRQLTNKCLQYICQLSGLKCLDMSESGIRPPLPLQLLDLTALTQLDLGGLGVTHQCIAWLPKLPDLAVLNLWQADVTDDCLVTLAELPSLTHLNLTWTGVSQLPALPRLKALDMQHCTIAGVWYPGVEGAVQVPHLERLTLAGSRLETPGAGSSLQGFISACTGSLRQLNLSGTCWSDLSCLCAATALQELDLSHTAVTDDNLAHIDVLPALRQLALRGTKVGTAGVANLMLLSACQWLDLSCSQVSDGSLSWLHNLTSLTHLDLSGTSVTLQPEETPGPEAQPAPGAPHLPAGPPADVEAAQQEMEGMWGPGAEVAAAAAAAATPRLPPAPVNGWLAMAQLRSINLLDTKVTNAGLLQLCKGVGHRLQVLQLGSGAVDDVGLKALQGLQGLARLELQGCSITGHGVLRLRKLPALHTLELIGCWLVTQPEVMHLLDISHPGLKIIVNKDAVLTRDSGSSSSSSGGGCKQEGGVRSGKSRANQQHHTSADLSLYDQRFKYSHAEMSALRTSPWVGLDHGGQDMMPMLVEQLPRDLRADLVW